MRGKETRKSAKKAAKKSPKVSKPKEKPTFTEVNKKIDSMLLNQQSILRRISILEDTPKGLEESYNFLSSSVDDLKVEQNKMETVIMMLKKDLNSRQTNQKELKRDYEEKL